MKLFNIHQKLTSSTPITKTVLNSFTLIIKKITPGINEVIGFKCLTNRHFAHLSEPNSEKFYLMLIVINKNKEHAYFVVDTDGVRIDFDKEWVHLRKSNTEPIIRIYSESKSSERANTLAAEIISAIREIAGI